MDKLFYIIYNTYYKHGKYKNDIPPLTVFGIFCVAICSVGMCISMGYHLIQDPLYFRHKRQSDGIGFLFLCSVVITYFTFYHTKRYRIIYDKFKDIHQFDDLTYRVTAFVFMLILIFSPVIFGLIYNKLYFGEWV